MGLKACATSLVFVLLRLLFSPPESSFPEQSACFSFFRPQLVHHSFQELFPDSETGFRYFYVFPLTVRHVSHTDVPALQGVNYKDTVLIWLISEPTTGGNTLVLTLLLTVLSLPSLSVPDL